MSRSIALGFALLVGSVVGLALWFSRAERAAAERTIAVEVERAAEARSQELLEPALPEASTTPDEAAPAPAPAADAARREELPDDTLAIAGSVVVDGGFPSGVDATVLALARRHTPDVRVPVAGDGSFVLRVPRGTSSVNLGLESNLLVQEAEVEARPGEHAVLRARLYAGVVGRITGVRWPSSKGFVTLKATLSYIDRERLAAERDPLVGTPPPGFRSQVPFERATGQAPFSPTEDGCFVLAPLATGVGYVVRVENPIGPAWERWLEPLQPGELRELEVALVRGVTIAGRVVDEHGEGVGRTFVVGAWDLGEGEDLATAPARNTVATDGSGAFEMKRLAPGRWRLSIVDPRFARRPQQIVDATAGDVGGVLLALERGGSIHGTVKWADGTPVERFEVQALGPAGQGYGGGDAGSFSVDGLPDGSYQVQVRSLGGERAGSAIADGVRPGEAPLDFVLDGDPAFRITGVVETLGGEFAGDAMVRAGGRFAGCDMDGSFELSGLSEGEWEVEAEATGYIDARQRVAVGPETHQLRLVLVPCGRVTGKVVDADGDPVAGAWVGDERGWAGDPSNASTDAEGRFTLDLKSLRMRLVAHKDGYAPSEALDVEVESGKRLDGVVLRLGKSCRVSGRVLDARGKPVPGADVNLSHLRMRLGARTDEQGAFVLDDLPAGTFELLAAVMDDKGEGTAATAMVDLRPERPATVELRLPAREPVLVRGRVTQGGRPVSCQLAMHSRLFETWCLTGADGSFEVTLPQPAQWVGVLWPVGHADKSTDPHGRDLRRFELSVAREGNPEYVLELDRLPRTTLEEFLR